MTDNLISVRALAARTREGREDAIASTVRRIGGYEAATDLMRASLSLDLMADLKANGGTLTIREAADRYGMGKSQADRYARAGQIVATHDALRDAVLAAVAADADALPDALAALAPVIDLLAVIGRNGTDRPAPTAAEIKSVALSPSDDPCAALDALIDARPVVTDGDGDGEGEGEGEGDATDATPEALAERDATMIVEAFARLNGRDGAAALIPSEIWDAIGNGYNVARDSRNAATRRARKATPAAA